MQRSSSSIASLAAALAKAQAELVNPEKSLVATIRSDRPGGAEQAFRYASLASGLDIVRSTLGKHEIAVMQTTAVDQAAGTVNLTTMLAHASGEWIASDWPVCAVSETAAPRRMGAALTYARRYALFTLVGIAGEDDLDAPDLMTPRQQPLGPERPKGQGNGHLTGGQRHSAEGTVRRDGNSHPHPANPILGADASAELRDRLLTELGNLASSDDAALWAHRRLPEKNRLTGPDALRIEEAFQVKLSSFAVASPIEPQTASKAEPTVPPPGPRSRRLKNKGRSKAIDKAVLAWPEPRRVRDRDHVRYVATQPCLLCGRQPSDPHHLRFTQSRALGRKVSDEFTVPLCRGHHREVHRCGDEAAWWCSAGIDPTVTARALWLETHPLPVEPEKPSIPVPSATSLPGNQKTEGNRLGGSRGANGRCKPAEGRLV